MELLQVYPLLLPADRIGLQLNVNYLIWTELPYLIEITHSRHEDNFNRKMYRLFECIEPVFK